MRILFYKRTNLARNPDLWAEAFNTHTDHKCRVVNRIPQDLDSFDFVHFSHTYEPFPGYETKSLMHYHGQPMYEKMIGLIDTSFPGKIVMNIGQIGTNVCPEAYPIRWIPMDLEEYPYKVSNPTDKIRIVYTPSRMECISHYHYKGWYEIIPMLERLKNKYPGAFEAVTCYKVERNICLAKKAAANIVLDECGCGSYHQSGMEGLAMGKMVFGGVLPMNNYILNKTYPGAGDLPYENMKSYAQMEETLEDIIKNNRLDHVLAKGDSNRKWMEKHWNLQDMLKEMEDIYMSVLKS